MNVGVDVGGTKIVAGAVDDNGEIPTFVRKPTPVSSPNVVVDVIGECMKELAGSCDVEAVSIRAAGFADREYTIVVFASNLARRNEPLAEKVLQAIGYRVAAENDANAAVWGEFEFGVVSEHSLAAVATVGTGIGGGTIVDGALLRGAGEFAEETGYIVANPGGQWCGCGALGCREAQASDMAPVCIACQLAADSPVYGTRMLRLMGGREITGLDVTRATQADDPAALECFVEIAEWIGIGMATLSAAIDPEVFVFVGGVSELGDLLAVPACTSFEKSLTVKEFRPAPLVKLTTLGNNAGIVGAVDLARR